MTADVPYEFLELGCNDYNFVPVPELEPAGRILLQIWHTLQQVDVNLISLSLLGHPLTRDLIDEPFSVSSSHGTMRCHPAIRSPGDLWSRNL